MVDLFGMKKMMNLAFFGHLVGIVMTLFARDFWMLFSGTLLIGIGNGMVEATCNPLIATLYPKEKTIDLLQNLDIKCVGDISVGTTYIPNLKTVQLEGPDLSIVFKGTTAKSAIEFLISKTNYGYVWVQNNPTFNTQENNQENIVDLNFTVSPGERRQGLELSFLLKSFVGVLPIIFHPPGLSYG